MLLSFGLFLGLKVPQDHLQTGSLGLGLDLEVRSLGLGLGLEVMS